jgi:hypothetical protein
MLQRSSQTTQETKNTPTLQGFVSNLTPLNCNPENLVARDGYEATIVKNRSDTWL